MPVPKQERALATRALILQAGARLFVRKHYDGVRIAELLAEANVTQGAFYFHFPRGKKDVAEALITLQEQRFTALRDAATRPQEGTSDALSALVTFLRALIGEIDRDPVVRAGLRLVLQASEHFPETAHLPHPSWIEAIEVGLRNAELDGSLRPGLDPSVTAQSLVFMFIGAQTSSFVNDSWHTVTAHGETLVSFVATTIGADGYVAPDHTDAPESAPDAAKVP